MLTYNDFGTWIRQRFPFRVQKIAVDAGFTCPNRDGRLSTGGCVYCDNRTFNPSYCNPLKSVTEQLEEGKRFFQRKYPDMKYLAYFQAFTNTYAPVSKLRKLYEEALRVPDVVGLVIGTRPDCVSDELLDYLEGLNRRTFLLMEYGVETANDATLRLINRGHDFACARQAVERTHQRGILTGAHVILGLPGEDAAESLRQAPVISSLPIDILKIHQLQIEIQSLIPEVRKNMRLSSSVEEVLKILKLLEKKYIITNIMLGYPGETDSGFDKQLKLIEEHGLYYAQVNTYDDTPCVPAHNLEQIPKDILYSLFILQ